MGSYSGHVGVRLVLIDKKNFKEDAKYLLSFDADISGENGEEYTEEEALENGFQTTAEYIVDYCLKNHGETEDAIRQIIEDAIGRDSYYQGHEVTIEETDTQFIVAVGYAS